MISLVIDTAVSNLFLAIVKDNEVLSFVNKHVEKDLSAIIFNELDSIIKESSIDKTKIDNILVAVGPGSFTGVRIGVTIAKTYAWALGIKAIPFSSLEFMCSGYDEDVVALIDARRGYVFSGEYDNHLNCVSADQYVELSNIVSNDKKYVSFDKFDNVDTLEPIYDVLKIVSKHINDEGINPHKLNPIYLKATEAEEKLKEND